MEYKVYLSSNALITFVKFLIDDHITWFWTTKHFGSFREDDKVTYYYTISFCSDEEHDVIELFNDSGLHAENMYVNIEAPITNDIIF